MIVRNARGAMVDAATLGLDELAAGLRASVKESETDVACNYGLARIIAVGNLRYAREELARVEADIIRRDRALEVAGAEFATR